MNLPERIAARTKKVRPATAVKTVVSLPFYLVGWIIGAVWFALSWAWAAIVVGFADGTRKAPSD